MCCTYFNLLTILYWITNACALGIVVSRTCIYPASTTLLRFSITSVILATTRSGVPAFRGTLQFWRKVQGQKHPREVSNCRTRNATFRKPKASIQNEWPCTKTSEVRSRTRNPVPCRLDSYGMNAKCRETTLVLDVYVEHSEEKIHGLITLLLIHTARVICQVHCESMYPNWSSISKSNTMNGIISLHNRTMYSRTILIHIYACFLHFTTPKILPSSHCKIS